MDHVNHLKHGKRHPLLLSPSQTFMVFTALFAGNAILLIALVRGAAQNEVALESIARAAELERLHEAEQAQKVRPPKVAPPETIPDARASGLQVSLPEGWKWRGCRASDTGSEVEILLGQ
jgi:hypothetical protein